VAQEAFDAPLPASWSEHTDDEGRLYFFREASGESAWEHPMDGVYRELVEIVRQARTAECRYEPSDVEASHARLIHAHLREVHQRALDALEGWSGPYNSEEGDYYYNAHLRVSVWESPLAEWNHELVLRHSVLCRCLLPDRTVVGADGVVERLPAAGETRLSGADLLRALQLPLELLRRGDNDDAPRTPSTSRDYHTARSGCSTTRSQLSTGRSGDKRTTSAGASPADGVSKRSPKRAPKSRHPQEPDPPHEKVTIFTRPG